MATAAERRRTRRMNVMVDIAGLFHYIHKNSSDHNEYMMHRKSIINRIASLDSERDRVLCSEMLEAQSRVLGSQMTTLGYQYKGEIYTVHVDPVPNCKRSRDIPEGVDYGSLPRVWVWVHSGAIFNTVLLYTERYQNN